MNAPEQEMVQVSPSHQLWLAPEFIQLIRNAPRQDFVVRTITHREAHGMPLMSAEMVIAGAETRQQFPLAKQYPMHFRKTYFPGRLHGDPSREDEKQQSASEILGSPPPIGWTQNTFRSCFVAGRPYSRLTPFGVEPEENNVPIAEELPWATAIGLWFLCCQIFDQMSRLHQAGLVHGDMELHNIVIAPAPIESVLIDFERSRKKEELAPTEWEKLVKIDQTEILKEAVYLQCALGRQAGPLAEMAMERMGELFLSPGRFERHIRRQVTT